MQTTLKTPIFQLQTCLVLALLMSATATAPAAQAVWQAIVGTSSDTNWSDLSNWQGSVNPSGNSCVFNDATGVGNYTTINNVVNTPENPVSVLYTNIGTYQNTLILPGNTLTIGTGGLTMGNTTQFGVNPPAAPTTTISGAGATLVTSNNTVNVGFEYQTTTGGTVAVLNMSGLDNYIATNMAHIYIGEGTVRASGSIYLATNNDLYFTGASSSSSPHLDIGDNSSNNGPGAYLYLGQTNIFYINDIGIGLKKQESGGGGEMLFNTAFNSPVAYFYGTNGVNSRVATWAIGDGQTASGTITDQGSANFSGGTVYAYVSNMWLGRNSTADSGAGPTSTGTLTLSAGLFSVNYLTNGWIVNAAESPVASGTINVNGTAVLSVNNNLVLATTNSGLTGLSTNLVEAQGMLLINGGTVQANNILTGGMGNSGNGYGAYVQMTGGTLAVTNTMGSSAFPLNYLILGSSPTMQFGVANGVTNAQVQDIVSDGSTATINISSLPVITAYPTQFPLITYQGGSGSGAPFSLGTMPGVFTGYVSNDNNSTVWLVVTGGPVLPKLCEWGGGVNDNWDITTLNWTNNGSAVAYNEGDPVLFNDLAQTATVNISAPHGPLSWTVTNNVLNYTFTGSGIQGSADLVKSGTASATLSESGDSFSGGISILGGTVVLDQSSASISGGLIIAAGATAQIGNNDANGTLPAGTLANSGTLAYDQSVYTLFSTTLSGIGGLTQEGSGTLALSAANTYTGNTLVSGGTLALTNSGSIPDSPSVTVNNATLDVSGVTGVTTLASLSMNNGSINVSGPYLQTSVLVAGLSMGETRNTINVISLPPVASYPTTITLVQSANPVTGFNMVLGTLPTASPAYAGSVSLSNQTNIVLTLTSGPIGSRPYVTWSGADVPNHNTNWTDNANWQLPGAPQASDDVNFGDVASATNTPYASVGAGAGGVTGATNINNIVNTSFTIAELNYSNVLSDYQNTFLNNGVALNVVGTNSAVFTVGSPTTDFGGGAECHATIGGANGTVNFQNTNGMIYVGLGDASASTEQAVLDMSGLGTLNASVSQIFIGVGSESGGITLARQSGIVYLAQTNNLTASTTNADTENNDEVQTTLSIDVGDDDGNAGEPCALYLGQTNAIYANAVGIGQQKATGTMEFNPYYTNTAVVPVAYFRGVGGGAMTVLSIGDGVVNSGTANVRGTCDFTTASGGSDGSVNALVTTLYVARAADNTSGAGEAVGTLSFDKGIVNAATAYVGYQPTNGTKCGIGTVNVGAAATLSVNGTLYLGLSTGGAAAVTNNGAIIIDGGTADLNTVVCGTNGGTNTISLNGGTLAVSGRIGAPGAGLDILNLVGGTLRLDVNGSAIVTNVIATNITTSGTTTLGIGSLSGIATGVTYPLISYVGTDPYSSLNLSLPAGYQGTLVDNPGIVGLQLTVVPPSSPPRFTSISVSGTTLNIAGTNGVAGGSFILLQTTNIAPPVHWTPALTNSYNANGAFNLSANIINPATPEMFFTLTNVP